MIRCLILFPTVGSQPIANAADLFEVLLLVDQQLLELPVAAAEFCTAPFIWRSVDVLVLVALTDDHVVVRLQLLEQLVARVELVVAYAAHRLYVVICFSSNPCFCGNVILVGASILVDDHVDVLA